MQLASYQGGDLETSYIQSALSGSRANAPRQSLHRRMVCDVSVRLVLYWRGIQLEGTAPETRCVLAIALVGFYSRGFEEPFKSRLTTVCIARNAELPDTVKPEYNQLR